MMKRMLFVLICSAIALGAIPDKLDTLHTETVQRQRASSARAILQNARAEIGNWNTELQAIADTGSFNTIDAEIKKAMQDAWTVLKTAETGFADPNITALLDWRPTN